MAFEDHIQDVNMEQLSHPVTELMHFLRDMRDWVCPALHAALDKMKGISLWISVEVRYSQPAR